ncbi:cation transporter [Chloroflexota bacterium]
MRIVDSVKRLLYTPEGVSKLAMFGIGMLILLKVFGAVVTGSIGIRSDAIHSGIDLVGAMVGFIAIRVALRPPDESHS